MSGEQKKTRIGLKGCLIVGATLLALLILVPAAILAIWTRAATVRMNQELTDIRNQQQPAGAADLTAYYVLPPGTPNNTQSWRAAIEAVNTQEFADASKSLPILGSGTEIPEFGKPWPQQAAVEQFLKQQEDALAELHAAADEGTTVYLKLNFARGFNMQLNHVQETRSAARLLKLRAEAAARRGDAATVVRCARTCLALSETMRREPVIISQLVHIATQQIGSEIAVNYLPHLDFTDEQLAELQKAIQAADFHKSVREGLIGERACAIEAFRNPATMAAPGGGAPKVPARNEDLALYLSLMKRLIAAAGMPWQQATAESQRVNADYRKTAGGINRFRFILTGMVLPAMDSVFRAGAMADQRRQVHDTLLALERFRLSHGVFPEQLGDLVPEYLPEAPVDPTDGQPLTYERTKTGVVVSARKSDINKDGFRTEHPAKKKAD